MCGICGIITFDKQSEVDREELVDMRDTMIHRGPDDEGFFLHKNIGLGHRRLSIIDLKHGHQPMCNEDKSIWITFNGEIYNYEELNKDLKLKGHVFKTNCDTETIVHLYEEYGTECVNKLNGMFSFGIWDANKQQLFIARDRLGIKPLYYLKTKNKFYFASEIKALLKNKEYIRCFNNKVIKEYVVFRYASGENTMFKGIITLLPGHMLILREDKINIRKYWDLEFEREIVKQCDDYYVEELDSLIKSSVKIRMMSDVPLGTFCSGGVDSSLITAYAVNLNNASINTFSIGFTEGDFGDAYHAQLVSKRFNTNHNEIIISNEEFAECLPKAIFYNEEPINHPNSVPLYLMSKYAKQYVTVILAGEGADEIFAGYPRYFIPRIYNLLKKLPYHFRKLLKTSLKVKNNPKIRKVMEIMDLSENDVCLYNSAFISEDVANLILSIGQDEKFNYKEDILQNYKNEIPLITKLLFFDIKTYLASILTRQDKMSMAASIEARVPFLDHRLVEFSSRIPINLKMKFLRNKYILKRLSSTLLPKEVVYRKKVGFAVPISSWLREKKGLGQYVELLYDYKFKQRGYFNNDYVEKIIKDHLSKKTDNGEIIWELINFELWHNIFLDTV